MTNDLSTTQLYELLKKSQEEQTEKVLESFKKLYKKDIEKIEIKYEALDKKYLGIERKLRKNNIIIFGLQIEKTNLLQNTLEQLNKLLELTYTVADINCCNVIGKKEGKQGILLEFISYISKQKIFKNIGKLKGKKIKILNDLCPEDQLTHKSLREYLNTAKEKNKQAKIKGHLLEIEGTLYTLEQLKEKVHDSEESDVNDEEEEYSEEAESGSGSGKNKNKKNFENSTKAVKKSAKTVSVNKDKYKRKKK